MARTLPADAAADRGGRPGRRRRGVALRIAVALACTLPVAAVRAEPRSPALPGGAAGPARKAATLTGRDRLSIDAPAVGHRRRGGGGYRTTLRAADPRAAAGDAAGDVPLLVVGGSPADMGWHVGRLLRDEIQRFVPLLLERVSAKAQVSAADLAEAWARSAAYTDDRFEQELLGLADGSGVPLATLQAAHALPLVMPYSCSSIAAWGRATADGHLYQTRNLDWVLELGAHEFPAVVLFIPAAGAPHLLPTFAGCAGANCGLSARGIVLAEMGYSPPTEMPYDLDAPHFTSWFRTILYDAADLGTALEIFRRQPPTKRYRFVFGDGRAERRAVKILSAATAAGVEVGIWGANDRQDPVAPAVLEDVVYEDEGRGIHPFLASHHGALDGPRLVEAACRIPIKGANVLDAVFDATALRVWISYAAGDLEAYERPFLFLDLLGLDADGDGRPDVEEGSGDADGDGAPDFLDGPAMAAAVRHDTRPEPTP